MKVQESGISSAVVAVVVIVIVALAGIAYYVSSPKSTGTTTMSTPASSTTTSSTAATTSSATPSTSSQATTTSTTSTTSSTTSFSTTSTTSTTSSTSSKSTTTTSTTTSSTTPSTSSTTSTTSSTSSSTATQTTSCSTTSTISTATVGPELVAFYGAYSSMTFGFLGTKNGATENLNVTYTVVYHSASTFKVSLSTDLNGQVTPSTVWILNNGDVVALYAGGFNYTGTAANNILLTYFADLETVNVFALQESTVTAYFHSAGTSTANIGTNSFTVTDYVANSTPETVSTCFSETATLDSYNVYLGTPSGSSLEIVSRASFSGTLTTPFGTATLDYSYQVTALTVA